MRQKAYYTADETIYNLYTIGQEWMTEDMLEYKGLYHQYITGETYTESTWRPDRSVKLIKFELPNPQLNTYKKIKTVSTKYNPIRAYYPTVTEADKAVKYIQRYFITKINETAITEIDEQQFVDWNNKKLDPNLYTAIKLIWYISGPLTTETINGIPVLAVNVLNGQRVISAERTMPGITKKLNNLLELYSDSDFTIPKDING
jgi:hypothetical protein